MKKEPLTIEEINILNEKTKLEYNKKYKLKRKIIQIKDYCGLKKGRIGYVTEEWPNTRVLFEDGFEPDIKHDFDVCLEATDKYCRSLEQVRIKFIKVKENVEPNSTTN